MSQKDERQLEMLKQEYKNILVPPQAKTRIQKGIDQAKKETKGVIIMKFFKKSGAPAGACRTGYYSAYQSQSFHCQRNGETTRYRLHRQGSDVQNL